MYSGTNFDHDYYHNNLDCTVTLQTTADRRILLTFVTFNVETYDNERGSNAGCVDHFRIFNGVSTNLGSMLNEKIQCGVYLDYPIIASEGNAVTFHLTTDRSSNHDDFEFVYTSFSTGKVSRYHL